GPHADEQDRRVRRKLRACGRDGRCAGATGEWIQLVWNAGRANLTRVNNDREMIYHLSLQLAGIIAGAFLILISLPGLLKPGLAGVAQRFPRSRVAGVVLLTVDLAWSFWLLATMEMGEFSAFRKPLLIALPIGYVLAVRFLDDFILVRV